VRRSSGVFDPQKFLESSGVTGDVVSYRKNQLVFRQGDLSTSVLYIQSGNVKLSVLSKAGRQAVVALLGPGDFFGEGCLAGQTYRMGSATAVVPSTVLQVDKEPMMDLLHQEHPLSDRFIAHMLARNIRIEQDLIDQLFNSIEKRLARTLLLLARYGKHDEPVRTIPPITQSTLAEMVGTSRSRVNVFIKKVERLGFISKHNGRIRVDNSLLTVVLHE
jgi:CRP-like cAMP-binding protein